MYDYIIVGSGLYGAIFAHEAMKAGKSCLVVERRSHIGGNIYTCLLYTSHNLWKNSKRKFHAI